jgi:hypothetical protein
MSGMSRKSAPPRRPVAALPARRLPSRPLAATAVFGALAATWPQLDLRPVEDTLLAPRFVAALLLLSYALAPWLLALAGGLRRGMAWLAGRGRQR